MWEPGVQSIGGGEQRAYKYTTKGVQRVKLIVIIINSNYNSLQQSQQGAGNSAHIGHTAQTESAE